jgi:hypothetical protein
LSSDRDDRDQAPTNASVSRNVVQAASAFSMKEKIGYSLGVLASSGGSVKITAHARKIGVRFGLLTVGSFIGPVVSLGHARRLAYA